MILTRRGAVQAKGERGLREEEQAYNPERSSTQASDAGGWPTVPSNARELWNEPRNREENLSKTIWDTQTTRSRTVGSMRNQMNMKIQRPGRPLISNELMRFRNDETKGIRRTRARSSLCIFNRYRMRFLEKDESKFEIEGIFIQRSSSIDSMMAAPELNRRYELRYQMNDDGWLTESSRDCRPKTSDGHGHLTRTQTPPWWAKAKNEHNHNKNHDEDWQSSRNRQAKSSRHFSMPLIGGI